jgi:hypothetical protein
MYSLGLAVHQEGVTIEFALRRIGITFHDESPGSLNRSESLNDNEWSLAGRTTGLSLLKQSPGVKARAPFPIRDGKVRMISTVGGCS